MTGEGRFPVSFAQERLWFLDQLAPGGTAYNLASGMRIGGLLDLPALERGLAEIMHRHEALRTAIEVVGDRPMQRVTPPGRAPLLVSDLSEVAAPEREATAARLASAEATRPFDLVTGPLVRLRLLRLGPRLHILVVVCHHIITDAWSMGVFWDELAALYEAFSAGRPTPLTELPVQYADYAMWQRERLAGGELDEQLAYWRETLDGAPALLDLPVDGQRSPVDTSLGARHDFGLPGELVAALRALCEPAGATLFMGLLAGFAVLLGRYSAQDDVVIGTPVAGRGRTELEGLVGLFVNTLPLRVDLSGDPTFLGLLHRVRDTALSGYAHQDVPFERLVADLAPERTADHHPLLRVMLVLHRAPLGNPRLPGLATRPLDLRPPGAKVDLSLLVHETGPDLSAALEYRTDLFDQDSIERMAEQLGHLLAELVASPDRPVDEVELLTPVERRRITVDWNDTAVAIPTGRWAHETVAAHAAAHPTAVAVRHHDDGLTYRELDTRANQLARHLLEHGVTVETTVGVCMRRSPEFVVAFLAVLKAGGTYLPLDPALPADRLAFMLAGARAHLLLTDTHTRDRLPPVDRTILAVDTLSLARLPGAAPDVRLAPDDLAYVIYTSGSTGTPKAVALPHRGLVNLVAAQLETLAVRPDDRVLQFASPGFDASVFELLLGLGAGAQVCLLDPDQMLPGPELSEVLREQRVSVVTMPPSVLALLPSDDLPELRVVTVAGEACGAALVARWAPGRHMFNLYGPTEATIWTTYAACSPTGGDPPIGRPIANTVVYVVDRRMLPVPVGVPGELLIGGEGLARGYLGQPRLTEQRFVADPFSTRPGARLYRTGDRVRWRPDGTLQFLGRLDRQVKIRGFRIEPGEVEATLGKHPAVRQVFVTARERPGQERHLVAYVATAADSAPPWEQIRAFLRERLATHLIPARFVRVDQLPLTPNGKIDDRALAHLDTATPARDDRTLPQTGTENTIARIWAELLRLAAVGVDENFFAIGGDSLLAIRVLAQIRAACGVDVPTRRIFDAPTVAGLACFVDAADPSGTVLAPLPPGEYAMSYGQEGLWFLDRLVPESTAYAVPVVERLDGPLRIPVLRRAIAEIVRRHEPLRTRFPGSPDGPVAVAGPPPELSIVELAGSPDAEHDDAVRRIAAAEAMRPFDLSAGPLVRMRLVRLTAERHVLIIVWHHMITDAWSMSVFWDELAALYAAFAADLPSPLPALPVTYSAFAAWQRDWLAGAEPREQVAYWRETLAGAPARTELPTDRPHPVVVSSGGAQAEFVVPAHTADALGALATQQNATEFMVLLAAFTTLLWQYSGQEDIVVGSPVAGRTRAELDGLIGFFVNTLALRVDLRGSPSFRTLLDRVRDTALGAYAHQELPFHRLVAELAPDRDGDTNPMFQVLFVLHNSPSSPPRLAGLTATGIDLPRRTAKFDLAMALRHDGSELRGRLEYRTDLFDQDSITRMVEQFGHLLTALTAEPDLPLPRLALLGAAERHRLAEWAGRTAAVPRSGHVHELFEDQARRRPDAVAVVLGEHRLTYRELDRRANQLADELRALGIGPDTLVGVCVDRSLTMVIALLAVLKAGGAFVPLDPALPSGVLGYMIGDTAAPVLLTLRHLVDRLPTFHGTTICLATDPPGVAVSVAGHPEPVGAEDLAYVIYTSGSTGNPKGVAVSHAALGNLVAAFGELLRVSVEDVVFSVTSFCFDVFCADLFAPLTAGATVVIADADTVLAGEEMARQLQRHEVTVMQATPGVWRVLLDTGWPGRPGMRAVCTGEAFPAELAPRLAELVDEVWNLYGPTEATVYATGQRLRDPIGPVIPIGRPLPNVRVHVVDRWFREVPVGAVGELVIGGAGVARGYLGRPDLTAERFVADPFSAEPGARLYRTGDRVRWLPDGTLRYLGRLDRQLKVRGFRIEPGEVEVALAGHPGVSHVVVAAREITGQDPSLVAYVVPAVEPGPQPGELRVFLSERLPAQLIPSQFVFVDKLPLTPNGKIDDRALARHTVTGARPDGYLPARTPMERLLARIWAELLGVAEVGVDDDFFTLGGDSLRAVTLLARIREATGVDVPVRGLFAAPTVAALIECMTRLITEQLPEAEVTRALDEIEQPMRNETRVSVDNSPLTRQT